MITTVLIFLCVVVILELALSIFYLKIAKVEWAHKKAYGGFFLMMSGITLGGAALVGIFILELLGYSL